MRIVTRSPCCLQVLSVLFALVVAERALASPPPLEIYGATPKTERVELSPDGTMLAIVGTENDKHLLSIQRIGAGGLVSVPLGDLKLANLDWVGNDYIVIYRHDADTLGYGGDVQNFLQGAIIKVKDGSVKPLVRPSPNFLPKVFGRYGFAQQDGHWFGYYGLIPTRPSTDRTSTTGSFEQRYPDLDRIDLESGGITKVAAGAEQNRRWVLDDKGQIVAESEYDPNSGNWRVFLPGSSSKSLVSGHSPFSFALDGLSRSPGTVLMEIGGEDAEIVELHLDNGKVERFLPPGDALHMIHSPSTRLLLGAVGKDMSETAMYDPTLDRRYHALAKAFQGKSLHLASVSADLNRIVVHVSGGDVAGTWQLVDFKTGKADPVAEDYPDLPDAMIGKAQMIDYRAGDGLALQGVLTLPPGTAPHGLPLVVLPHGGPESFDFVHFDWWAQAFAARGYAVFQPNFRGSGGYGTGLRNAGFGQWGRKMQTDISDGVAALAAQGIVDPHRSCIVGASYGGYAALAGVTLQHGLYRCAASYGGVTDMHDMMHFEKDFDRGDQRHYSDPAMRYWISYLGVESADDTALDALSPRIRAAEADAPVLLIYGEKDTVVPPSQSKNMAVALKYADKAVELAELDDEDHWLSRTKTRQDMLKAMVAFVEKYNPPDKPPH
jgi:dienelactone hydrolase